MKQKGLLLEDPQHPHREVRVERTQGFLLNRELGSHSHMLRPGQNKDLMAYLCEEERKKRARAWRSPLSGADVAKLIEKGKGIQMEAAKAPAKPEEAAPLAEADVVMVDGQKEDAKENDLLEADEEEPDTEPVSQVPVSLAGLRLAEGQSTGKGKTKGKNGKPGRGGSSAGSRGGGSLAAGGAEAKTLGALQLVALL